MPASIPDLRLDRYRDVLDVLADPRFEIYKPLMRGDAAAHLEVANPATRSRRAGALSGVLARHLSGAAVARMAPRIRTLVREILARGADKGEFDALADLAYAVPATVMADLLGHPADGILGLRPIFAGMTQGHEIDASEADRQRARLCLMMLVKRLDAGRVGGRPTPLVADALAALGGSADDAGALGYWRAMIFYAGSETTKDLIANVVAALLESPVLRDRLAAAPVGLDDTLEELIRLEGPVGCIGRVARERVEIGSNRIERGQLVHLMLGDANRDVDAFGDAACPHADTPRVKHLAFGHGPTHCLGARLARQELEIVLTEIRPYLPHMSLAEPSEWTGRRVLRERASLRIRFAAPA